ncbi:MAG TPA: pyrroline-5-carboxylate reductase, partial [Flavobacteriia bacterium]|nr:pyrroline-5-carboxylate reductase [Flavobacteriia bacterium]
ATVLGASGIAFAMRFVRASMQAGIEIGFESDDAQKIAAQTIKGAVSLLLKNNSHPESEIDKVTTPLGITITGLNTMEQNGFSASLTQGIKASYDKIKKVNE